ncbi:hypothetical protein LSTR_LSTR012738 [Laodelphax striatellus]|uniref:ODAD1 central coiled coil region domain-containing protein n=1 Tax=Laodelphax striatellus TaxID=195883 RepID=A0A482X895_LAOST|nr:hypothetical protein LSTR_LSTR012738 [Laodelphax striatellus]
MLNYERQMNEEEKLAKAEKDYRVSQKKLRMNELKKVSYPPKHKALIDRQVKVIGHLKQEIRNLESDLRVSCKRYKSEEGVKLLEAENLIEKEREMKENVEAERKRITELQCEIDEVNKAIMDMQRNGMQVDEICEKIKKKEMKLDGFEGSLQVATNKFNDLLMQSEKYRKKINLLLEERKIFHAKYMQLYRQLLEGKQTMLDIVEQATKVCDQKEEASRKLMRLQKKKAEEERNYNECVQQLQNELDENRELDKFLNEKNERLQNDNEAYQERKAEMMQNLKEEFFDKFGKYSAMMNEMCDLYGVDSNSKIDLRYKSVEVDIMQLVCYINFRNSELIELQDSITELNLQILDQQELRELNELEQEAVLEKLQENLQNKTEECRKAVEAKQKSEWVLNQLLTDLEKMFIGYNCDSKLFFEMLGDNAHVNVFNYHTCLAQIESQIHEFVCLVFCKELAWIPEYEDETEAVVQDDYHMILSKRPINYHTDSLSPCPLCQEMIQISTLEEESRVVVLDNYDEIQREEIRAVATTPDGHSQEILHNLSKCQLPRSRAIMQAKFQEQEAGL